MKIAQLKLWRFRCFGSSDPTTDRKPNPQPIEVTLEEEITTLIGRNGSGKSALLLFGAATSTLCPTTNPAHDAGWV